MTDLTGPDLRRERRLADVTVTAVARHMGLSRQTVTILESAAEPDPDRVRQHREAVAALVAVKVAARESVA